MAAAQLSSGFLPRRASAAARPQQTDLIQRKGHAESESSRSWISREANKAVSSFVIAAAWGFAARGVSSRKRRKPLQSPRSCALRAEKTLTTTPYTITPIEGCAFGGIVEGFDLRTAIKDVGLIKKLREDMAQHSFIVFRGQSDLSGDDHIALSEALGSMDHDLHKPHPKAPEPRLLRISNSEEEGFVQVGTSGWHVDGVMLKAPFHVQTMHFLSAIAGGDTLFLGFNEFLGSLNERVLRRLRKLWFVSGVGKDLMKGEGQLAIVPLVYRHPFTGDEGMCFHLGKGYCLGWFEEKPPKSSMDTLFGTLFKGKAPPSPDEMAAKQVLRDLLAVPGEEATPDFNMKAPRELQTFLADLIEGMDPTTKQRAILKQEWRDGDFALIDNMAVAHLPTEGTQAASTGSDSPGIRIFHRTTMVDRSAAAPVNFRGAESVLLVDEEGNEGQESIKSGSKAGARRDSRAVRVLTQVLAQEAEFEASAEASSTAGSPDRPGEETPQPRKREDPREDVISEAAAEREIQAQSPEKPKPIPSNSKRLLEKLRRKAVAASRRDAADSC
eukprot:TRINITY_DN43771_c0_g1_i1.p1 TRINITY_DN43771_c0_g1~~TRINITY_DN43771_c0_g1_i1.p1  ORF type:complete len:569 (+),score=119.47 TRINITY_DN43771_c0_g1_i1:43-1707(+)